MLWNRLTCATTLLGIFSYGCSSGSSTLNGDNNSGSPNSEETAGQPSASGAGGADEAGGANSSGGAASDSTGGRPTAGGTSSGGVTSEGSGGRTGGAGTGGDAAVPDGHLANHCEAPDAGEVFCIENGNGYPGETITLPYFFYYSAPHDGLASGTAVVSLPEGFSLANPAPAGVGLCGYLRSVGTTVSMQFNPIDYHWQQGSDCPMTGTQFEVYQMEVTIDASVAPGDYELAIVALAMSGAQDGAPEIPPGPSSKAPGVIRVLEN